MGRTYAFRQFGYASMKTWNPRSSVKPSTISVRTRPPTSSEASTIVTRLPASAKCFAAVNPAMPAPMTMASAFRGGAPSVVAAHERGVRKRRLDVGEGSLGTANDETNEGNWGMVQCINLSWQAVVCGRLTDSPQVAPVCPRKGS